MTAPAKKIKLSAPQKLVLQNLVAGKSWDAHISGRSSYGGANSTLLSLTKNGLLIRTKKVTNR